MTNTTRPVAVNAGPRTERRVVEVDGDLANGTQHPRQYEEQEDTVQHQHRRQKGKQMTVEKQAREAVIEARNHVARFALSEGDAVRVMRLANTIESLLAEVAAGRQALANVRAWSDIPLNEVNGDFAALESILNAAEA